MALWCSRHERGIDHRMDTCDAFEHKGYGILTPLPVCAVCVYSEAREPKVPIRIVPLKQGFIVQTEDFLGYEDDGVAFTDAVDLADWLLEWLGFDDEIVESVRDILAGLWDADELVDRDGEGLLDIAQAALSYVETPIGDRYRELVEAVKKWWAGTDEEVGEAAKRRRGLT